jgi:hypothetical protein
LSVSCIRSFIYTDTSILLIQLKEWSDGSNAGLKAPVSKVCLLSMQEVARDELLKALLMFRSDAKTRDYHQDNFCNYEKWLKTQLMSNLPNN